MKLPVEVQGKENVTAMCEAIVRHCAKLCANERLEDEDSRCTSDKSYNLATHHCEKAILAAFDLEEKK